MRKIIYILVLIFGLTPLIANCEQKNTSPLVDQDRVILISNLIGGTQKKKNIGAEYKDYKKWSGLYTKYRNKIKTNPSEQNLRIYLLIVFIAYESGKTSTIEDIAKGFKNIFNRNGDLILNVLADRKFMISSTCKALWEHHVITGQEKNLTQFISKHRGRILSKLGKADGERCLMFIKRGSNYKNNKK